MCLYSIESILDADPVCLVLCPDCDFSDTPGILKSFGPEVSFHALNILYNRCNNDSAWTATRFQFPPCWYYFAHTLHTTD